MEDLGIGGRIILKLTYRIRIHPAQDRASGRLL
jgi:hypothetical protein